MREAPRRLWIADYLAEEHAWVSIDPARGIHWLLYENALDIAPLQMGSALAALAGNQRVVVEV